MVGWKDWNGGMKWWTGALGIPVKLLEPDHVTAVTSISYHSQVYNAYGKFVYSLPVLACNHWAMQSQRLSCKNIMEML